MRPQGRGFVGNEETFSSSSSYVLVGTAATDSQVIAGELCKTCQHPLLSARETKADIRSGNGGLEEILRSLYKMQDPSYGKQDCTAFYFSPSVKACVEDWQDFTR